MSSRSRAYAPRSEIPVELLRETTGGIPAAVQRTAAEWARAEAEKRLGGAAGRAAAGRSGLRMAEDDLAGSVVELQALVSGRSRAPRRRVPVQGLSPFDVEDAGPFFGRERLVAEMIARLPGTPLMEIVGPVRQRKVVGAAGRAAGGAANRCPPRERIAG